MAKCDGQASPGGSDVDPAARLRRLCVGPDALRLLHVFAPTVELLCEVHIPSAAAAPIAAATEFLSVFEAHDRHLELALTVHTNKLARRRFQQHIEDALTTVLEATSAKEAIETWRQSMAAFHGACREAWELHTYFVFLDLKGDRALLEIVIKQMSDLLACSARSLATLLSYTRPWVEEAFRAFADRSLCETLSERHSLTLRRWRAEWLKRVQRMHQLEPQQRCRLPEAQTADAFWDNNFFQLSKIVWPDFAEAFEAFYLLGRCPVDLSTQLRRRVDPKGEHRVERAAWHNSLQKQPQGQEGALVDALLADCLEDIRALIYRPEPLPLEEWPQTATIDQAPQATEPGAADSSFSLSGAQSPPGGPQPSAPKGKARGMPADKEVSGNGTPNPTARPFPGMPAGLMPPAEEGADLAPTAGRHMEPSVSGPDVPWSYYQSQMCQSAKPWWDASGDGQRCARTGTHEPLQAAALRAVCSNLGCTRRALILRVLSGDLARHQPVIQLPSSGAREKLPSVVITAHGTQFSNVCKFGRASSRRSLIPDLPMDEPIASRSHFNITYEQGADKFHVMDAGSKWGTFVKVVDNVELSCGDWIRAGNAEFFVRYCGGGCKCRKKHTHYKLHALRVHQQHALSAGMHAGAPSAGGAGAWAWEEPVEPETGSAATDECPMNVMSGVRHGAWVPSLARLARTSAGDEPGQRMLARASGGYPGQKLSLPMAPLELEFVSGPRTGERLTLTDRISTMGRAEGCTVQVSDPMLANISRVHCIFEYTNNRWHIRDTGSTNGTWRRLSCVLEPSKPTPLTSGVSILAGAHEFRVEEVEMDQWWFPSIASQVLGHACQKEERRQQESRRA